MSNTIESTHNKILDKFKAARDALNEVSLTYTTFAAAHSAAVPNPITKNIKRGRAEPKTKGGRVKNIAAEMMTPTSLAAMPPPQNPLIGLARDELERLTTRYNLAVTVCLVSYYMDASAEARHTSEYYRIITSEGYLASINVIMAKCVYMCDDLFEYGSLFCRALQTAAEYSDDPVEGKEVELATQNIESALHNIRRAHAVEIDKRVEEVDYEVCSCGTKMDVNAFLSQLHCPSCGFIDEIVGVAFSDTHLYTQEKAKHAGYDVGRHYRFWIERIQAIESKTFSATDTAKIEYALTRDQVRRSTLNITIMRRILSELGLTTLNEHAALLVVQHGGPAPPKLTFAESMRLTMLFNKIMDLYDVVMPGKSNRPYYPYFIYKLIEQEFDPPSEKLRLLNYIHLQSPPTVIKNDNIYRKICELAAAETEPGEKPLLRYRPTERL